MTMDSKDHTGDASHFEYPGWKVAELTEEQRAHIRLIHEVIDYNNQAHDSPGASWRSVIREPDEHEEDAYSPYVHEMLMNKILERAGGGGSRNIRDYLHIDADWQVIRKLLKVGYILCDPTKQDPWDFVDMINMLEVDYAREYMNCLFTMDDDQMREALWSVPRSVLDMVHCGALRFDEEICAGARLDIEDYKHGEASEDETEKSLDDRDSSLASLRRIISAIDEVLEKRGRLEAKRNQPGEAG